MKRVAALVLMLGLGSVGCSGDDTATATTGFEVEVRFGSHLPVATIELEASWNGGQAEAMQGVLPHVGPATTRSVRVSVDVPETVAGQSVRLIVSARRADGTLVGQAAADVATPAGQRAEVSIELGPPDVCGDGVVRTDPCDDGNVEPGDGCDPTCQPEPGFVCRGSPSRCALCGDGRVEPPETCDDGNREPGDGCSAECQIEPERRAWTQSWQWSMLEVAEADYTEVATLTLPPDDRDRLVFFSGVVFGDGNSIVEVRLDLGETAIDEFGYDLRGPRDGAGPGFFTFEVVPAALVEQALTVRMRTNQTFGGLRDLRVVAAAVPPGAGLVSFSRDNEPERTGLDLLIDTFDLPPGAAGEYLVLAKMSLTEMPGGDTARGWLELPDGTIRPIDDRGVTFSAPRRPLSPLLTGAVVDVPGSGATLSFRGESGGSGSASLQGWAETDADFRVPLQIEGPAPAGYALRLTFDHAEHVARSRSRADGDDVVIVYRPPGESPRRLHRVLDPDSGWNRSDTTVWFKTEAPIEEGGTDLYELYFGGLEGALDDPQEVFAFHDDFSSGALDQASWDVVDGTGASVTRGRLRVEGPAALASLATLPPDGARWEARLRLLDPVPAGLVLLAGGALSEGERLDGAALEADADGVLARTVTATEVVRLTTPTETHDYAVERLDTETVVFRQDGAPLASLLGGPLVVDQWSLLLVNAGTSGAVYDWVRARPYLDPEPTVALGDLQGSAGVEASRFRYRKLAAVRLDAWATARVAESGRGTARTTDGYAPVTVFEVDADADPGERLILQSVRVAGDNDAAARRRGVLRRNDQTILATGHRIDRDASAYQGYHHVAGLAYVGTTTAAERLEVGVDTPDGIEVTGADGRIVVLDYPR